MTGRTNVDSREPRESPSLRTGKGESLDPDDNEPKWIEAMRGGDRAAFDALVNRHRPRLVRILTSLLWDCDEAESLAQEALARAWGQRAEFRPGAPFGPWVTGIGINLSRTALRARARHAAVSDPHAMQQVAQQEGQRRGVLSGILKRELHDHLTRAVDELPLPMREVIVLHDLEGLEFAEISVLTGVAEGTLRVRAHRARGLLRDALGELAETWCQAMPPRSK